MNHFNFFNHYHVLYLSVLCLLQVCSLQAQENDLSMLHLIQDTFTVFPCDGPMPCYPDKYALVFQNSDYSVQFGSLNKWGVELTSLGDLYFRYFYRDGSDPNINPYISRWDGSWNQLSDFRFKKNIQGMESALPGIREIYPITYQFIGTRNESPVSVGFVAQDIQKTFPYMVKENEYGYLTLDYSKFGVLAIKAIQEQQEVIESLTEALKEQQKKMARFEDLIRNLQEQLNQ